MEGRVSGDIGVDESVDIESTESTESTEDWGVRLGRVAGGSIFFGAVGSDDLVKIEGGSILDSSERGFGSGEVMGGPIFNISGAGDALAELGGLAEAARFVEVGVMAAQQFALTRQCKSRTLMRRTGCLEERP